MAAHPSVAVIKAYDELLEDPLRLCLRQPADGLMPQDISEKVATLRKFHGDCQVCWGQEHLRSARQALSCEVTTDAELRSRDWFDAYTLTEHTSRKDTMKGCFKDDWCKISLFT